MSGLVRTEREEKVRRRNCGRDEEAKLKGGGKGKQKRQPKKNDKWLDRGGMWGLSSESRTPGP